MTARHIEVLRLGGKLLLRSRATGACVLSNDDGLAILDGLRRNLSQSQMTDIVVRSTGVSAEVAADLLRATLESWSSAGLLAEAAPEPAAGRVPANSGRALTERTFALGRNACTIRSPHRFLLDQIEAVLAGYRAKDAPEGPGALELDGGWNEFRLVRSGALIGTGLDHDQVRHLALREAIASLAGRARVGALLHAACVAQNGRCIVLPGPTGSGKTTLALALMAEGWLQAADDLVPLLRDGRTAAALPTRASVKRPGPPTPPRMDLGGAVDMATLLGVDFRNPEAPAVPGALFPISALIFPQFNPIDVPSVARLAPEDTLVALLKSGSGLLAVAVAESMGPLATLCSRIPAYRVIYPHTEAAIAAVSRILALSVESA